MPTISKIRLTNVIYEEGNKRYNDELFLFDGHNGAILIENGGGKTVFIQTALQAILPHIDLADRKIKNTLMLDGAPAHIAIEWIINERPRRYVVTAVSLFTSKNTLDSLRYVYEYQENDLNGIEGIPFVRDIRGGKRPADRGEMQDYYSGMHERTLSAQTFKTIKDYEAFIEEQYNIISSEWESVVKINGSEGGVEAFFDECKNTSQLFDRLLIPTVEDSMVGHDRHLFADLFEKQLESFKNYQKLKEMIEENEQISSALEDYSKTSEALHEREMTYIKTKQQAKGIWKELTDQQRKQQEEQEAKDAKVLEWKNESFTYAVKVESYKIFTEQTALETLEQAYKRALALQLETEEQLQKDRRISASLQWAKACAGRKDQMELLQECEHHLEAMDQRADARELRSQFELARRQLLGCLLQKIESLETTEQELKTAQQPIIRQMSEQENVQKACFEKVKMRRDSCANIEGRLQTHKENMGQLIRELPINLEQETVKDQLEKWKIRDQFLDKSIIALGQKEKILSARQNEAQEQNAALQVEKSETIRETDQLQNVLAQMERAEHGVIDQLASLRAQWGGLETVYLDQDSIIHRLCETIDRFTSEREELFYKERVARRFVDDHGDQSLFFGDAYLDKRIPTWKNQFRFLATGVEYLQMVDDSDRKRMMSYSLWPLTLVTTASEKPQLLEKLDQFAARLQYPITVLSTEEALSADAENAGQWVAPAHWRDNANPDLFAEWKQRLGDEADQATERRVANERESARWKQTLHTFRSFLKEYPYQTVEDQRAKKNELQNNIETLTLTIRKVEQEAVDLESERIKGKNAIDQHREERSGLAPYMEKAQRSLVIEKTIEEEKELLTQAKEKVRVAEQELTAVLDAVNALNEKNGSIEERLTNVSAELRILRRDDDYITLRDLTPEKTDKSKAVIKEQIKDLEMRLKQISKTRGEWEEKRKGAANEIKHLEEEMRRLRREYDSIDETQVFPGDGDHLIDGLRVRIKALEKEREQCADAVQTARSEKDKQDGKLETCKEQFQQHFPNEVVVNYHAYVGDAKQELQGEKQRLNERKHYLDQETGRIEKELTAINQARTQLDKFEIAHHFTAPDLEAITLTSQEINDLIYNRKKSVSAITRTLEENQDDVTAGKSEVDHARQTFKNFCRTQISDVKLRQMAISGIETKQSYEAIVAFKKNMSLRIERISHYAREHIRQRDKDLQLFIDQIHTHLLTLAEELRQIPKKTKVKVKDDWKQIYSFTIPEWKEEDGKARIRNHIEWILSKLDDPNFKNEEGMQDSGKIHKALDTWLQSKQLLREIIGSDVLKVTLRKVASDSTVSTRFYTWETSNIWSGGERWSKNMTLFLGILNYVAEKKKHLQASGQLHRSVILDNPFGQASSDHVLSPVFFVAQQLGFQIIALTALAEGKFLQDYFPIIYSCRLRESSDAGKQVMTKEKRISKAFFEDHDPQSLERLGEIEQLGLFDD
ncbi:hypothetical protein E4665_06155 [Sporolactobacillus shoreae]|uniref:Chromosome segregation ATPase n=1 Tax=Sporolactobacillus shoreae TaxID=1465501 RepID=A0A4Z0GR37_9BACL|nr:hypothetical protein [Sporolactobacillus shoreae]TGA98906.1 hypothetical protein E4665_06155 [Sporolactobacillus shoreae]